MPFPHPAQRWSAIRSSIEPPKPHHHFGQSRLRRSQNKTQACESHPSHSGPVSSMKNPIHVCNTWRNTRHCLNLFPTFTETCIRTFCCSQAHASTAAKTASALTITSGRTQPPSLANKTTLLLQPRGLHFISCARPSASPHVTCLSYTPLPSTCTSHPGGVLSRHHPT